MVTRARVVSAAVLGGLVCVSILALSADTGARAEQEPQAAAAGQATLKVMKPVGHGRSAPLKSYLTRDAPGTESEREAPAVREPSAARAPGGGGGGTGGGSTDPVLQTSYPPAAPPMTVSSFDGIGWTGSVPPDTNVAVGDMQVVEVVNTYFAIFDKSGNLQAGPSEIRQMFASLPTDDCYTRRGSDPIVLYDRMAGRWLIARYVFATNFLCVALSQTSDATGAYYLYSYYFGPNTADYPKFGVWPDAYYFTANSFAPPLDEGPFIGAQACAFDRASMLVGAAGTVVCFQGTTQWYSLLPADLDSDLPPPAGSPAYFMQLGSGALGLFKFRPDFVTPSNSTFIGPTNVKVGKFANSCSIPQPDVPDKVESLSGRLMYRLSYRNFGAYESLLATHTVQIKLSGGCSQSGIRWYEIRTPGGTPTVRQQSTFSPNATTYRWMPSIAQDRLGNILLGFSASSTTVYPAIRYTVRLGTDPLNQMQPEQIVQVGVGAQTPSPSSTSGRNRWGDYASVSIDPTDGCTMWFATEYLTFTGYNNWATHLISVRFPGCS